MLVVKHNRKIENKPKIKKKIKKIVFAVAVRVLMTFKGIDNPIEVKEQELITKVS